MAEKASKDNGIVEDVKEPTTAKDENAAEQSGEALEKEEGAETVEAKEDASVPRDLSTYELAKDVEFDGEYSLTFPFETYVPM